MGTYLGQLALSKAHAGTGTLFLVPSLDQSMCLWAGNNTTSSKCRHTPSDTHLDQILMWGANKITWILIAVGYKQISRPNLQQAIVLASAVQNSDAFLCLDFGRAFSVLKCMYSFATYIISENLPALSWMGSISRTLQEIETHSI